MPCPRAFLTSLVLALVALGVATPALAQWKWRDRTGGKETVKYSDMPPPGNVPDSDILQRPAAARRAMAATSVVSTASGASAPLLAPRSVEPELEAARKKKEQEQAAARQAEEAKVAAARAENCQRARTALRTYDDGMRIARVNANGEREILNDQQRAVESQKARDAIASDCK